MHVPWRERPARNAVEAGAAYLAWLGIGLLFAGAATINTLMAGLPRILYGMALDGALPKVFTYLHPRFKTPLLCIAVAVLIPCLHAWWLGGSLTMGTGVWSMHFVAMLGFVSTVALARFLTRGDVIE